MPSPFPGFDPFIEDQMAWPDFRADFLTDIKHSLLGVLPPGFNALSEGCSERHGDARFLRIVDLRGGETTVAVIKLISPAHKDGGAGSTVYRREQKRFLDSPVHFIEINLLRGGNHAVCISEDEIEAFGDWNYLVTLHDRDAPEEGQFWRVGLRDPLPAFAVPLTAGVAPVPLDLRATFARCYDASRMARILDYTAEPTPPLSPDDSAWGDGVLRSAGLRGDE